jgi:hypothetical protein
MDDTMIKLSLPTRLLLARMEIVIICVGMDFIRRKTRDRQ